MRWRSAYGVVTAAALIGMSIAPAAAQDTPAPATPEKPAAGRPDDNVEILREKMRADKKLVVATALELTDEEGKRFWPVYGAYQSDMVTHYDRYIKLLNDYLTAYASMTDAAASKLVTEFVALEADHAAIQKKYLPEFQKAVPGRKVARFYQLENKIRSVLRYDLAREIPLTK